MSKSDIQAKASSRRRRGQSPRVSNKTITLGEHDQVRLSFVNKKGDELFDLQFLGGRIDEPHVQINVPAGSKLATSLAIFGLKV